METLLKLEELAEEVKVGRDGLALFFHIPGLGQKHTTMTTGFFHRDQIPRNLSLCCRCTQQLIFNKRLSLIDDIERQMTLLVVCYSINWESRGVPRKKLI